ncbi:DarT ssDNA thymidine ADP-ribosyltransferase family protein [Hafnia paralvei]|uniref:DarT ssDNA thymidine ADP-ribosyltransferase family protein n=1 Tax=Hafnia paralvei TaxID=546367 RepID=UPI00267322F0|nr:DarT ssDNA thymidine ADP-ribosyltransferase family protein [Hafnia paralvei]
MTQRIQQIKDIIVQRSIMRLVHFTRVENLASIMQNGIVPIANARVKELTPAINDTIRLDGYTNASCLSITFPNHLMFYKYRQENPHVNWVVLWIDPSILWLKNCAFCRHNAADARIRSQLLNSMQTPASLSGMFDEIEGVTSRQEQRLLACDTSDVQAEVLVFDVIEPQYISRAAFNNQETKDSSMEFLGGRQTKLNPVNGGSFATRSFVR